MSRAKNYAKNKVRKKFKKRFPILAAILSMLIALGVLYNPSDKLEGYVSRVVDGDTIIVELGPGQEERVRMIGVDTPESVHPDPSRNTEEGREASDFTKSQLLYKDVELELDQEERDQYGRMLAYVWVDGELFNLTLVREGYGEAKYYPPNDKYRDTLEGASKVRAIGR